LPLRAADSAGEQGVVQLGSRGPGGGVRGL
jgi:hypothetical protein